LTSCKSDNFVETGLWINKFEREILSFLLEIKLVQDYLNIELLILHESI